MIESPSLVLTAHQRRSMRRAATVPCQVVAEHGFRLLGTQTLDLSHHGLLVRSDAHVEIGEEVYVSMRIPGGVSWLDALGRVARVVHGLRGRDVGRAVGVELLYMEAIDRALLEASLRGRPPPIPARHLRQDYAATVRRIRVAA